MVGMGGVRGDVLGSGQATLMPYVLDEGERGPNDFLHCPHHSLQRDSLHSEALQPPNQTEMQLVSRLSMAPL